MKKILRDNLLSKIKQIDEELYYYKPLDFSLYMGKTGIILYFTQRYISTNDSKYEQIASKLLRECVDELESNKNYSLDINGYVGVLWLINHLLNEKIIDFNPNIFKTINETIYLKILKNFEDRNLDFFYGANGLILYMLDCQFENKEKRLNNIVELYSTYCDKDEFGITWYDISNNLPDIDYTNTNVINFGISHGVTANIYILNRLLELKINEVQTTNLLILSTSSLLSYKNNDDYLSTFPGHLPTSDKECRLAWCYGDLSIANTLLKTSKLLRDTNLYNESIRIIDKSSKRKLQEDTGLIDPSFCHGSNGVAYLYFKYYKQTKNSSYLNQAQYWLEYGLNLQDAHGVCNFDFNRGSFNKKYALNDMDYSFLMGIAGIGLVSDSMLNPNRKNIWDRFLMLA